MEDKPHSIVPEWISAVREFQQLFSSYFPHMKDDLDIAGFEMEWIETRVLRSPLDTVRRSIAKRELRKLPTVLKRLGKQQISYWLQLNFALHMAKENREEHAQHLKEIFDFLLMLNELHEAGTINAVLNRFSSEAQKAIDKTVDAKNINWESVRAIDGLRDLWWRNTGIEAPSRALNPASRFAQYLAVGFVYLEVEADHISAFKRWAAVHEKVWPAPPESDPPEVRAHPYPYLTE